MFLFDKYLKKPLKLFKTYYNKKTITHNIKLNFIDTIFF